MQAGIYIYHSATIPTPSSICRFAGLTRLARVIPGHQMGCFASSLVNTARFYDSWPPRAKVHDEAGDLLGMSNRPSADGLRSFYTSSLFIFTKRMLNGGQIETPGCKREVCAVPTARRFIAMQVLAQSKEGHSYLI